MFCEHTRDFSSNETNIIEIISGRVAADLERQLLLHERIKVTRFENELAQLDEAWRKALPSVPPIIDGWEVAADTSCKAAAAGDFYDWFELPDGRLSLCLGIPVGEGIQSSLIGASMRAMLQTQRDDAHEVPRMLQQVNQALWRQSAGDYQTTLFYALVDPASGRMEFNSAGGAVHPFILRPHAWEPIGRDAHPLGTDPEFTFRQQKQVLAAGDVLLVIGQRDDPRHQVPAPSVSAIAEMLLLRTHLPSRELANMAIQLLESGGRPATVLIAKRRSD
jgi:sigma-B regulation protein RsbU (phosphoserine phosphatase)